MATREPPRPLFMAGMGDVHYRDRYNAQARQLHLWRTAMNRYRPGDPVEVYVRFQIGGVRYSGEQVPKNVIASLMGHKPLPKVPKGWRPRNGWTGHPAPQRQLQVAA